MRGTPTVAWQAAGTQQCCARVSLPLLDALALQIGHWRVPRRVVVGAARWRDCHRVRRRRVEEERQRKPLLTAAVLGAVQRVVACCGPLVVSEHSHRPNDLSGAATYDLFLRKYERIIANSVRLLRPKALSIFVVGDVRDNKTHVRSCSATVPPPTSPCECRPLDPIPSLLRCPVWQAMYTLHHDTVGAFKKAGMAVHQDAVLCTAIGTAAMRATRTMSAGAKLINMHQNVVVTVMALDGGAVVAAQPKAFRFGASSTRVAALVRRVVSHRRVSERTV